MVLRSWFNPDESWPLVQLSNRVSSYANFSRQVFQIEMANLSRR